VSITILDAYIVTNFINYFEATAINWAKNDFFMRDEKNFLKRQPKYLKLLTIQMCIDGS
jgi:hypothetical protein